MKEKLNLLGLFVLIPYFLFAQLNGNVSQHSLDSLRVKINNTAFPAKADLLTSFYLLNKKMIYPSDEMAWVNAAIEYYSAPSSYDVERVFEFKKIRAYYNFRSSDFEKMTEDALQVINAIAEMPTPSKKMQSIQAKMYLYLAGAPYVRQDSDRSIKLVDNALGIYRHLKDTFNIAHCLKGLAANFSEKGETERALNYMDEAAQLFEAANNPTATILAKHGTGSIHLADGNWHKAIETIEPLIPQMRKSYKRPLSYALSELAVAKSKIGKKNAALGYLHEADTSFNHSRDIQTLLMFYECSAEVYEELGNFEKALFFQKKRKVSQDSLNLNLNKASSTELEATTALNEKIVELESLAKGSKSTFNYKLISFCILSALATLFFAFFYNRKKKKETEATLILLQQDLEKTNKLKDKKTAIELTWNELPKDTKEEPSNNDQRFLQLFTQKVQNRISDVDLTVESLAEGMKISRVALYKRVKAATNGSSPSVVIRTIRLETGKRLLESKKLSVYEVAESVGFKNTGNFSRAFKSHFGISPSVLLAKDKAS